MDQFTVMKNLRMFGLILFCSICFYGCDRPHSSWENYRGPFEGWVVDAKVGAPIEGAVIFVRWDEWPIYCLALMPDFACGPGFNDAAETATEGDGHFFIPKKGTWNPWKNFNLDSDVVIFKAGYQSLRIDYWRNLKNLDFIRLGRDRPVFLLRKVEEDKWEENLHLIHIVAENVPPSQKKLLSRAIHAASSLLPKSLDKVQLEMPYSEIKNMFPESIDLGNQGNNRILIVDILNNDEIWDSVRFIFKKEHLGAIDLIRGTRRQEGMQDEIARLFLKNKIAYGTHFDRKLAVEAGRIIPVLVWDHKDFIVYFSYTPREQMAQARRPQIRYTISIPEIEFSELFESPTLKAVEETLFDMLQAQGVK